MLYEVKRRVHLGRPPVRVGIWQTFLWKPGEPSELHRVPGRYPVAARSNRIEQRDIVTAAQLRTLRHNQWQPRAARADCGTLAPGRSP